MEEQNNILDFWFGPVVEVTDFPENKGPTWFAKNDDTDNEIREKFSGLIEKAINGELDHWASGESTSLMALIILLDQFTRNTYRGSPKSFAGDPLARKHCLNSIVNETDKKMPLIHRCFLYLPLEHSEKLEDQKLCLELYNQLVEDSPLDQKQRYSDFRMYAQKHFDIIERFGRFPHRNKVLNRESTPEEIEFLTQPGSSF